MKTACFIPIKANSERVPGKNLRLLNGKKLYRYICEHVREADVFDDVYVDTNSQEVARYAREHGCIVIPRREELARAAANGNDLLMHHYRLHPEYDYYFQLFATAPYLQADTIRACAGRLLGSARYDSCFTATERRGFYWLNGMPVNYRPDILPRSQDMTPMLEESTGLYGIRRDALEKYHCRIGSRPYIHRISSFEAVDINTEQDLELAAYIGRVVYHLEPVNLEGKDEAIVDTGRLPVEI